jgi:hypothetical protein
MVRLGKCDGVDDRVEKNPHVAESTEDVPLKLKSLLNLDEERNSSDLLRLRESILNVALN